VALYKKVNGLVAPTVAAGERTVLAFGCIHECGRSPGSSQRQAIAAGRDWQVHLGIRLAICLSHSGLCCQSALDFDGSQASMGDESYCSLVDSLARLWPSGAILHANNHPGAARTVDRWQLD
jgi:hypothetical protein